MRKDSWFFKVTPLTVVAILLVLCTSSAPAQPKPYYGALLYSMPRDTSVPPVYPGQPPTVTTGYLWLDEAMRNYSEFQIEGFFNALTWSDTMKTFASIFYQASDDNPLSFRLWSSTAIRPNPYKGSPGQAEVAFPNRVAQIAGDSGRTASLLSADIIADVMAGDTICVIDPKAYSATDAVLVNSTILDEIKGKKVPLCVGEDMRAQRKKGATVQSSGTIPWATSPVPADSGTCLQFEYSPEWSLIPGDDEGRAPMGWWVKPGHEYIVFLNFVGIGADNTTDYFTIFPAALGSGGVYPVVAGIVQDPGDDYGIGAGIGLPVSVWKSRIRARIKHISNFHSDIVNGNDGSILRDLHIFS